MVMNKTVKAEGSTKQTTKTSKTIGWLNKNALMTPIMYSEVVSVLDSIGEDEAGKLLSELGEKAHSIKNPTSWLTKAAERISGGEERPPKKERVKVEDKDPSECKWCEKGECWTHGQIEKPEGNKPPARKGKGAGKGAGKSSGKSSAKGGGMWVQVPFGSTVLTPGGGAMVPRGGGRGGFGGAMMSMGNDSKKISKAIGWMNKNLALPEPIMYAEVAPMLDMIGDHEAGKLLHEFQESADSIKNPTRWLMAAARRAAGM